MNDKNTLISLTVRLDPFVLEKLNRIAKKSKLDKSSVVRNLIDEGLSSYNIVEEQIIEMREMLEESFKIVESLTSASLHQSLEIFLLIQPRIENESEKDRMVRLKPIYYDQVKRAIAYGKRISVSLKENEYD